MLDLKKRNMSVQKFHLIYIASYPRSGYRSRERLGFFYFNIIIYE
jgi:hypothetical protein